MLAITSGLCGRMNRAPLHLRCEKEYVLGAFQHCWKHLYGNDAGSEVGEGEGEEAVDRGEDVEAVGAGEDHADVVAGK